MLITKALDMANEKENHQKINKQVKAVPNYNAKIEELKKRAAQATHFQRQLEVVTHERNNLRSNKEQLEKTINKLSDTVKEKENEITELTKELATQKIKVETLQSPTRGRKKKRKPDTVNRDLKDHVESVCKTVTARTVKFIHDEEELKTIAEKRVCPCLPVNPSMGLEEFSKTYGETVNQGIKSHRQDVQAACKKRAQGMNRFIVIANSEYPTYPVFSLFLHNFSP